MCPYAGKQEITPDSFERFAAVAFCEAWGGPVALESDNRKVVLVPLEYCIASCCTPQEAEQLREELHCEEEKTNEGTVNYE